MTSWKPNPPPPLEFQIILRARTDSAEGKWVNVIITRAYTASTMKDYDGSAIGVDLETIEDRLRRSLLGDWP